MYTKIKALLADEPYPPFERFFAPFEACLYIDLLSSLTLPGEI